MNINEIRIGNLFIGHNNKITEWTLIDFVAASNDVEVDEIIKSPILLTDKILIDSGFDKNGFIEIGDGQSFSIYDNEVQMGGTDACISGHCFSFKIEYVHELQNLFIDLKKELKIKL